MFEHLVGDPDWYEKAHKLYEQERANKQRGPLLVLGVAAAFLLTVAVVLVAVAVLLPVAVLYGICKWIWALLIP